MRKKPRPPRSRTIRISNREIRTVGGETAFWSDLYHRAMTAGPRSFVLAVLAVFLANNLLFACLYALDPASVNRLEEPHFLNLFFFAVEAFTTVGFGEMHPGDTWGHVVYSLEGFVSLVQTAALTGLIFARFSRPRARILFADHPVISEFGGAPHLMFRLANARQNFISDATAQLWLLRDEVTPEGHRMRRFHELQLSRQQNPTFVLSWTLFHAITKASPLHGMTAEDFAADDFQFILTIKGVDDTSAQDMRARKSYSHEQVLWGHAYEDIIFVGEDGVTLDYRKFHHTKPA
ncbi:MAG: hypothetical protein KGO53_08430 [Alphaproteobacteria bacterium]|nr:hypothetical protein [Alphaproteobacteria bacterium]